MSVILIGGGWPNDRGLGSSPHSFFAFVPYRSNLEMSPPTPQTQSQSPPLQRKRIGLCPVSCCDNEAIRQELRTIRKHMIAMSEVLQDQHDAIQKMNAVMGLKVFLCLCRACRLSFFFVCLCVFCVCGCILLVLSPALFSK